MSERFRVTSIEYRHNGMCGVSLEENDVASDGKDAWAHVDTNHARTRAEALDGLKRRFIRDHEERMRAIEAAR